VLESVSRTGGHLSSNLGTVELTIALQHVFETPEDRIVWDVGHQTYPHKILTGRRDAMSRLRHDRRHLGLPARIESRYDTFGTAHSSTSISAALEWQFQSKIKKMKSALRRGDRDGAMSAGIAYEAMNNAGAMNVDLLVILNDNEMSISASGGRPHEFISPGCSPAASTPAPAAPASICSGASACGSWRGAAEEHMKGMVTPSTLFEEFGFNYIGPIDGHDLDALIPTLAHQEAEGRSSSCTSSRARARATSWPRTIRSLTHGRQVQSREGLRRAGGKPTYSQIFGEWLCAWRRSIRAWWRSRRRCAKASRHGEVLGAVPRALLRRSASPSSTR